MAQDEAKQVESTAEATTSTGPILSILDFANHYFNKREVELMAGFIHDCKTQGILHATEDAFKALYEDFRRKPVK